MKTGRKAKPIINQRFGNCIVLRKKGYKGNNLQYLCECDCGAEFTVSGQQLRSGITTSCPDCRKRKVRESREIEFQKRLKLLKKLDINAQKLVLMNPAKTKILRGANGMYSYFDKAKARLAAQVLGNAVAVPLSEAIILCP